MAERRKAAAKQELEIGDRRVPVSNLEKVFYPESGFTKAQVIDYYIRVSEFLLPHMRNRPVTLKRFPDGVRGQAFYEKDAPGFTPKWIQTFPVPRRAGGTPIQYILINDLPTLVWCANAAAIELHPFLHCAPELQRPTSVVFDLDPGVGSDILTCAQVAFIVKDGLQRLGLECFPKVSGSKGIQLYVPLNTATTYEITQPFARALADLLAKQHPKLIVAEMAKSERTKKVFIDWSQNSDYKTTVGVYSLRAKLGRPFASLPVSWEELKNACESRDSHTLYFQPEDALKRMAEVGDLFAPVLTLEQNLPPSAAQSFAAATDRSARVKTPLRTYAQKRDFSKTAEPAPTLPRASAQGGRKRFVIQKHAASHLHYDFRLEMHNVLKSWAVPKGVPLTLDEKRLAMATEDHPIDYLQFEGTIPAGQYGGGTVMVWDIGTYELMEGNYYKGYLHIYLEGRKLKGEWVLTKDRAAGNNKWSLVKAGVSIKPLSAKRENVSALTRRTLEQIASANDAQWHSNRTSVPGIDLDNVPQSPMEFIEPMQCKLVSTLPEGAEWQYEAKLDGYRALGIKTGGDVKLLSRRNNLLNDRFAAIPAALNSVDDGIILDGAIVALDAEGRTSFNLLQHYKPGDHSLAFYIFDLLAYRARDTTALPLKQRRALLESIALTDPVRLSASLQATPEDLIAAVRKQGLEGVIAKRTDSRYEPGQRSGRWVKFKVNQGQELVVGGYKPGGKNHFDNLAVGYYDAGRLIFIAKLKNGFTPEMKDQIFERLKKLETRVCPFDNLPEPKNARRGEALTSEAMKKYRWIKPALVVQVEFTDWTAANHLRHSSFAGIRDDKNPREVVHEVPEP
ncbi:MAG: non-homologous end-joining DNA ligase [Acidobacteriaceae bacterium]|nr:non-homologous end-joining DNA ligase [Acidobacteriaceae bacterium]